ncbi:MAG TPA: TraR/DksA C4-type zinc finger protein, partial [Sandaracinaceae bacterium]
PKAAKSTAPKAAKTPAAPKATKPAARPQPAEPPPPERPAELELEAVAADTGAPEPETSREAVPRVAPTGPISAHPDAQLTQEQVEELYSRLVTERNRVIAGFDRHLSEALGETEVMPDETDMAQRSTEQAYLIRFADKERKLLSEIEHALEKMRTGEYGVCEGTEEPIGFKRLELRPWTRYSVSYKEQMERERSQHRR